MLEFGVLGPLTVERAGVGLALPSGRARVLLGALIVNPGAAVSMDELIDRVWGRTPPRTAATAVHGYVSRLRKTLGDSTVRTTPNGYQLAVGAEQVDSGRFRSKVAEANREKVASVRSGLLREALRLWRGPALADLCYEPFAQSEIAALEEMRVTATEDAVEADLAMGRHAALVSELQGLVRQHPLRERLCGQLMIALYGSGRQAEALTAYRRVRTRMVDDLGVDPGPALRALEAAILRQDPALVARVSLHERKDARTDDPLVQRIDRGDATFVGRSAELDRMRAILDKAAIDRCPALVTVVGEPGVGKSRLAGEFVAAVQYQVTVLTGQCEPDLAATYAPLHQMLAQVLVGPDGHARDLVALLQETLDGGTAVGGGVIVAAAIDLFGWLARQRPVVLVLEDIHWAQPGLLDLIEAVVAKAEAAVMVVCLARPELTDLRPAFGSDATDAFTVELGPMSQADVRSLVLDLVEAGSPTSAVDEIVCVAEGNPFFAMQLVAWAGAAGGSARGTIPPAVRTLLAKRISGLGPGELAVVSCAAVVGRDFLLRAVTALLPADAQSTMERNLAALERHQLVESTGGKHRFRHHLIHQTAYLAIDPSIRARLHEEYADWLIADTGADPASVDEMIGYHLEQAHANVQALGMREGHVRRLGVRAASHLAAAGRRAYRRVDMPGAASLLARALQLLPRDDPQRLALLLDSARPLRLSGRTTEAVTVLLEAIDRAQDADDVSIEWRARLELGFLRTYTVHDDPSEEELQRVAARAIQELTTVEDHEGLAFAWVMIGQGREAGGRLISAASAYRQALAHVRRAPTILNYGFIAWGLANVLLAGPTPVPEAISRCRELLDFEGYVEPGVMLNLSVLLAMNGDFDEARAMLSAAAVDIKRRGLHRPPLFLAQAWAQVELMAEEPVSTERHARQALALGSKLGGDMADPASAMILAQSLCRQHRFDEAEEVVAAHAGTTSVRNVELTAVLNAVRAEVRTHRGAWADAVELGGRAVASVDHTDYLNLRAELRLTLAAALRASGDAAGGGRVATEALELFKAKGNVVGVTGTRELLGGRDAASMADRVDLGGGWGARMAGGPEDGRRLPHPQAP